MRLIRARAWVSMLCRDQTEPWPLGKPAECKHLVKKGLEKPHLPAQGAGKEACLCQGAAGGGGEPPGPQEDPGLILPEWEGRHSNETLPWDAVPPKYLVDKAKCSIGLFPGPRLHRYSQGKQAPPPPKVTYKQYRTQGNTPPRGESEDSDTSSSP